MKPRGKHPDKRLNAARINALSNPGRYGDGNGLYLVVAPSGSKRWILRTVVHGKRTDIGLGGLSLVSLKEARESAAEYRKIARAGGDPLAEKRNQQKVIPTFAEAAEAVHAEHKAAWKNKKHAAQWINTLKTYANPEIGNTRVDRIDTPDVRKVLSEIWLTKPETARRLKQRISTVLDWSTASGFREGENPVASVAKGLPKQPEKKRHFAAMPYVDIPGFIDALLTSVPSEQTRLAIEFTVLTAARTGEVIASEWPEMDFEAALWTVPAERMKAGVEHRIPLPSRTIDILERMKTIRAGSSFVFSGRSPFKSMSNMTMLKAVQAVKPGITVHGFRSAFRDWAAERTNFPRDVCEMALAHTIPNKAEAAYRRGDLLAKRRELMNTWAEYVRGGSGRIVHLRAGGDD